MARLAGTLERQGIETEILPACFAAGPGTRRRVALHARRGSREAAKLGYKARKSWDLVDIEVCPISDPAIQAALPALKRLAAPLFEHPKSAPTLHVTCTPSGLDVDISGVERKSGGLSADARMQLAERAAEADFARVTIDGEAAYLARLPQVRLGQAVVSLPPGAFLQATPGAEAAMSAFVAEQAAGAARIADLYCGVGTFTFRLAEIAQVYAADFAPEAIRALTGALAAAPGLHGVHRRGPRPGPPSRSWPKNCAKPISPSSTRPAPAAAEQTGGTGALRRRPASSPSPAIPPPSPATPAPFWTPASPSSVSCLSTSSPGGRRTWSWWGVFTRVEARGSAAVELASEACRVASNAMVISGSSANAHMRFISPGVFLTSSIAFRRAGLLAAAATFCAAAAQAATLTAVAPLNSANASQSLLGINDAGWITGGICCSAGGETAFVRDPNGVYTTFNVSALPGSTEGRAISNTNTVVGYTVSTTGQQQEFSHTAGGVTTILAGPMRDAAVEQHRPGDQRFRADRRQLAAGRPGGRLYPEPKRLHHLADAANGFQARSPRAASTTAAWWLASRRAARATMKLRLQRLHLFLREGHPGAVQTILEGVNNAGVAVGTWTDAQGLSHGFLEYGPLLRRSPTLGADAGRRSDGLGHQQFRDGGGDLQRG